MEKQILTIILLTISTLSFAQIPSQPDSLIQAKYRTEIALDLNLPDFDTKEIDPAVIGSRLVGILDYLLDNYHQLVYNRQLAQILKKQVPSLECAA